MVTNHLLETLLQSFKNHPNYDEDLHLTLSGSIINQANKHPHLQYINNLILSLISIVNIMITLM